MTRYVPLCSVSLVFVLAPRLPAQQTAPRPALATGTLAGIIRDATSGRPLPHALVTVGYLTRGLRRGHDRCPWALRDPGPAGHRVDRHLCLCAGLLLSPR